MKARHITSTREHTIDLLTELPVVYNESGSDCWMTGFGCLRAEKENRSLRPDHLICFAQNQRNEMHNLGDHMGALVAEPGMKQHSYLVYILQGQEKDIDRANTMHCSNFGAEKRCLLYAQHDRPSRDLLPW